MEHRHPTIELLYAQHRDIVALVRELMAITSLDPFDLCELTDIRRRIAKALGQHMADENRLAVTPLAASADPADRALARFYTEQILSLRERSSAHHARWNVAAIALQPYDYRLAVQKLFDRVIERREWEEAVFLPAAARLLWTPQRRAG